MYQNVICQSPKVEQVICTMLELI